MGIQTIAHMCSHLQNASRARLGITSIPNVKYNLRLAVAMHRAGFISSVTRAGPHPPPPDQLMTYDDGPVTAANVSSRRLWLGLKYWNNEPVMSRVRAVSTPKRIVVLSLAQLERVARGFREKSVAGLEMGECLFVSTDRGILEVREALEKKVGGAVLCRVS
jgi:small subunit ribosomal protein S8